jgi:DNA-binding MarR family transcriptional regulator
MNKEVLIQLIEHMEKFEATLPENRSYALPEFVGYLNAQAGTELPMRQVAGDRNAFVQQVREDSNSDVGILITLMFRYAKTYIKKALQDSPIQTADEFAFLITLMTFDSLTKTELINKQVMEKTSGTEVIKRLAAQGMIREFADASDKRSIRVVISDMGRIEIIRILPEMAKVSQIVVGNLSDAEIKTLSYLLKKLDFFHNDIFMNKRHLGLDDIMQEKAI